MQVLAEAKISDLLCSLALNELLSRISASRGASNRQSRSFLVVFNAKAKNNQRLPESEGRHWTVPMSGE